MTAYGTKSVGQTVAEGVLSVALAGTRAAVAGVVVTPSNVRYRGLYNTIGFYNITATVTAVSIRGYLINGPVSMCLCVSM